MAVKNFNGANSSLPIGFNRGNPMPLDSSAVWKTLAEAQAYAQTNPVAYVGQVVAVVEGDAAKAYIISNEAGDLVEVGAATLGDNNSIELSEGILKLVGFDAAETGAQLLKGADGKISWVKPDTTTVEGLNTTVEGHTASIQTLSSDVATLKGDDKTEGSVAYQIAQVVAGADEHYDTLKEIADWITSDSTGAAKIANDVAANGEAISALQEKVGETSVADQIAAALKDGENDKYALASDLTTTNGNVSNNASAIEALQGKVGETSVADQIAAALQSEGKDKYALAATVTDLQTAVGNKAEQSDVTAQGDKIAVLEGKNWTVLDAITADKTSAWDAAQPNVIEAIKVNGTALEITNKAVDINLPAATAEQAGLVKVDNDTIKISDDKIYVDRLAVSKLYIEDGTELILNGGNA